MKLNLGAANRHIDGYLCVDIAPPECAFCGPKDDRQVNLNVAWPWDTSSVGEVLALDLCEHIRDEFPRLDSNGNPWLGWPDTVRLSDSRSGRIWFMNELHRVLTPGGRATIETPNAAKGVGYYQDPTHCSPYCLSTFKYFEAGAFAHTRLAKAYGITAAFKVISLSESRSNGEDPREEVWKIKAVLEAVK
jgi:hypothetical protein